MTQTVLSEATQRSRWRRVLLKVSGEAFAGERRYGIDAATVVGIAHEIASIHAMRVETAVVVGGGNIIRGEEAAASGMERSTADHMGMLATIQNALALQDALEKIGVMTRVQSAIVATAVAEPFIRRRAIRHLEKGRVVILAAGTGNPYFSTDTAAALRALELKAEAVLKATNVDGVYDKDPKLNHDAKKFASLTYEYAIEHKLGIMDLTAFTLCMENELPIVVFNIGAKGNMKLAAMGENIGTTVGRDG